MGALDDNTLNQSPHISYSARQARFVDGDVLNQPDDPVTVTPADFCTYIMYDYDAPHPDHPTDRSHLIHLVFNSKCIGSDLPQPHEGRTLESLFDYQHPQTKVPKGSGTHRFYIKFYLQQNGEFDTEVADGGLHHHHMRGNGIFGDNQDPDSFNKFDVDKFEETYNLALLRIGTFTYNNECSTDPDDCPPDQECRTADGENQCFDLDCSSYCTGSNTECVADNNVRSCECEEGYPVEKSNTGGSSLDCVECEADSDCADNQECNDSTNECQGVTCDPSCGDYGYCISIGNHQAECKCIPGYHFDSSQLSDACVQSEHYAFDGPLVDNGPKTEAELSMLPKIDTTGTDGGNNPPGPGDNQGGNTGGDSDIEGYTAIGDGASCETIEKFDVEGALRYPNQADGAQMFSLDDIDKAVDACNEHAQCKGIIKDTLVQLCSDAPVVTQGVSGYGYAKDFTYVRLPDLYDSCPMDQTVGPRKTSLQEAEAACAADDACNSILRFSPNDYELCGMTRVALKNYYSDSKLFYAFTEDYLYTVVESYVTCADEGNGISATNLGKPPGSKITVSEARDYCDTQPECKSFYSLDECEVTADGECSFARVEECLTEKDAHLGADPFDTVLITFYFKPDTSDPGDTPGVVYTEVQDMECDGDYISSFSTLDEAKAGCTSNPECRGIHVANQEVYLTCERLVFKSGETAFEKGVAGQRRAEPSVPGNVTAEHGPAYTIRKDTGCKNVGVTPYPDLGAAKVMCDTEPQGHCIGIVTASGQDDHQLCIGDGTPESGLMANSPGDTLHYRNDYPNKATESRTDMLLALLQG